MNRDGPIRIVGVGSAHGDDAVAWHVVEELQKRWRGPSAPETYRIEGGGQLLDLSAGCGVLILVDAVQTGGTPGTIHRFTWPDARIEVLRPGCTHQFSPAEALQLAETLGWAAKQVIIFGVEIAEPVMLPGLTPALRTALPGVIGAIVRAVESMQTPAGKRENHHA